MIFIAGSHPKSERYLTIETAHCFHCNNTSRWIVRKNQQFLSLFFLPVVPLKTEYLYSCSICGNTKVIDRDTFELKKQNAEPLK